MQRKCCKIHVIVPKEDGAQRENEHIIIEQAVSKRTLKKLVALLTGKVTE
jgi:hypothetical protein